MKGNIKDGILADRAGNKKSGGESDDEEFDGALRKVCTKDSCPL